MPATRIRHLSPTADFLGPWSGKQPTDPVPARHVIDWLQDARRRILAAGGTEQEADSLMVAGGSAMALTYTDDLTEIEQARDELAAWRALAEQTRGWVGRDGASQVSQTDFLRYVQAAAALLGNPLVLDPGSAGTQAPAAPPATPNDNAPTPVETSEQRRARFDEVLKQSGFKWPDDAMAIANMGQQHGFTLEEVNRWTAFGAGA